MKVASFVLPVVNDIIYLAQRGTEPHKGKYGQIGGKAMNGIFPRNPDLIVKPGNHRAVSIGDHLAGYYCNEPPRTVAHRELGEELFQRPLAEDEISDLLRLGVIWDYFGGQEYWNYQYIARVHAHQFNPSPREITDIKPLRDLDPDQLFPMAKLVLTHIAKIQEAHIPFACTNQYPGLAAQIPPMECEPMDTNLLGALMAAPK